MTAAATSQREIRILPTMTIAQGFAGGRTDGTGGALRKGQ